MTNNKFKKGIVFSSAVIVLFMLYCISEMIVSWCVDYTYYYMNGRLVAAACLLVVAIVYGALYKKIGIFPSLICLVLFFSIAVDFLANKNLNIFFTSDRYINNLKIFPLIMQFVRYRDLSHPENATWADKGDLGTYRYTACTIIFVIALILGILVLAFAVAAKKSKIQADRASVWLFRISLGLIIFLFIEFMRSLFTILAL